MPRWLRQIIDGLAFLVGWITGRQYDTLVRSISDRADAAALPAQRRFIIVQIDGLAHDYLVQAMALGQMPTVQRLIAQGARLQRWRCGLPTSTPAIQAGIMYGCNWDIPAFRWYEKESGFAPQCKSPAAVERVKARVAAGRPGILAGGSSYTNMLDGDARLALFTLSAMGRQRFFEHLRGIGWALLFALIPWRILRSLGLTAWELARSLGRALWLWARGRFRGRLELVRPVLAVLTNIIFGEIQAFGVLLDIYRGVPSIYVNFYGYDEVAHGEGPLGREAVRAVCRIDRHIREIERMRRRHRPDTELYICSDHGMTPALPFHRINVKQPLGPFVAAHVGVSVVWDEIRNAAGKENLAASVTVPHWPPTESIWLLDELDGVEAHLSGRSRRLAQVLHRRLGARMRPDEPSDWDFTRGSDVVVRASGSLAHLYFNVTPERMDVSELAILYPDLVEALNNHPGIGLVLGVEEGRPVIVTSHGTAALAADWLPPGLADPQQTVADLERLLSYPHSGDLVLLGAWDAQGRRVVAFEEHAATHGGIGGPQEFPFFITPPDAPLELSPITNACQLYPYFMARYHGETTAAQGEAGASATRQ